MKKKSLLALMGALSLLLVGGIATGYAAVSGACVECHTMHNSQGGTPMAQDELGDFVTDTFAHLTRSSCVGCHFTATDIPAPKIDGQYNFDSTAGGTFKDSGLGSVTSDAGVHNVDIALSALDEDDTFTGGAIPGLGTTYTGMNLSMGSDDPTDLTCAGSNGCHGDSNVVDNDAAIEGFHHGNKEGFRYLQIADTHAPVSGKGAADWEKAMSEGWQAGEQHNVYSSDTNVGINKLCANCHPNFHEATIANSTKDVSGNWIRHPTDNNIPSDWSAVVDYRDNPFAFADISTFEPTNTYTNVDAQVACISCHRAHGTPYDDILRWDYSTQNAGGGYVPGCLGCHTKQQ